MREDEPIEELPRSLVEELKAADRDRKSVV